MKKANEYDWWLLWVLLALACLLAATVSRAQPLPPRNPAVQSATLAWLTARLNVRELTARPGNDGPEVAAVIKAGGGNPKETPEYCGFSQAADQKANGLPIPKNGMQGAARYWFMDVLRTFYKIGIRGSLEQIQPGDLVGVVYGGAIHHIMRLAEPVPPLRKGRPPRGFYTLAGNEGRWPNAGFHRTYYPATSIAAAARWDYK